MSNDLEIKERVGGYDLSWSLLKLRIGVSRIKQHRDNRITGWVMIKSSKIGKEKLLHQSDFNFTSTQTQKTLASTLTERYDKYGYSWNDIIETLRYHILERVRQGEPVLTLNSDEEGLEPPIYLVDPLLPELQPTIIFGDPGVGKSYIGLIIYICLILPWYDNPLGLTVSPERSIRPLILDYETDAKTIQWRMKRLQQGMGLPPFDIHYRRCSLPIADDLEQIQIAMAEKRAEALIIDSLASAAGGELKDTPTATNFFFALRQLKTTSFIIAQTQKDPEKKIKTVYGAGLYQYYSRSIWEARKAQRTGEDEIHLALHHRKSNESKLFKTIGYKFYFNEAKTLISTERTSDVPEFREDMKTQDKVLIAVKELIRSDFGTIAEAAGVSDSAAKAALSRLKSSGKVINFHDDNTWGAIAPEFL